MNSYHECDMVSTGDTRALCMGALTGGRAEYRVNIDPIHYLLYQQQTKVFN